MNYDVFISYNSSDKHIADAVCHYLEERKLRCFIAPRDIVPPDWAGSITRAIEHSQAFVIVVSEHSIQSNEVAKEITLATRVSNYIFPFRVDDSMPDGRMTYHLSAFHWIDAITPPMEQRLKELAERIVTAVNSEQGNMETSKSRNSQRQRLLGRQISPRAEFSGRKRELLEIQERFDSGSNAIFLCGMGGIGKSEIAKAYAKAHSSEYHTIVFASYETDLLHLFASDQSIPIENLTQACASGGQGETLESYFERKLEALHSITDKNTLLIIDNFDTEEDKRLGDVLGLPCRLLFTTRTDFSLYGYETVKINAMEHFEDLVQLFERIDRTYASPEDQQAVENIIKLLDRHTYAVSLTAAQMKAGHIRPQKMLTMLKEQGLNIQTRSSFARDMGTKKATAYEYIQALFDFSGLDGNSLYILQNLACVPQDGIDIDLFMECTEVEDFGEISRLIDLNWIQHNEELDRIGLHMLIREMLWDENRPTLKTCSRLLNGVRERVWNAWNQPYEENCRLEGLVYSLMEHFPNPTPETLDIFESFATFAWIQGNFDLADSYEHKLYKMCEEAYGLNGREAGNQALRVAAVYHNMGDYAQARPWYDLGWKTLLTACGEISDTWRACMKVGRSDAQNKDFKSAEEKYTQSLEGLTALKAAIPPSQKQELRDVIIPRSFALMDLAHIYTCQGRCEEALPLALESYEALKADTQAPALVIYAQMVLAYVYYALEDYVKSLHYVNCALEDNLHFHGENNIDTMYFYEMQGDIYAMQQQFGSAGESYSKALGGRETCFPADQEALERLEQKYACAKENKGSGMPFLEIWP